MTALELLAELEALGTEQNRKIYRRHAADPNYDTYGVSFANLYALQKRIRTDHALALALWPTGKADARIMALFIADPAQGDAALLDRWAADVADYGLADAFGGYAVRTAGGVKQALEWIKDKREFVQRCGWNTLSAAMKDGTDGLSDAQCAKLLGHIERHIHKAPNRAREGMNYALIAFGVYKPQLREAALAAAGRIGKVDVDHGETGCKTRDATEYILKAVERRAKKAK
ncbi:MAG TPA: DNA alkylation repair protein [Vicinamibacterales bacterium]|nr:DNA alkylation repair protein [Vicinamibacterales bacterium]